MPVRTEYEVWRDEITAPARIVTLGWVFRQLLSLFAVFSFLGFVLTLAIGAR